MKHSSILAIFTDWDCIHYLGLIPVVVCWFGTDTVIFTALVIIHLLQPFLLFGTQFSTLY